MKRSPHIGLSGSVAGGSQGSPIDASIFRGSNPYPLRRSNRCISISQPLVLCFQQNLLVQPRPRQRRGGRALAWSPCGSPPCLPVTRSTLTTWRVYRSPFVSLTVRRSPDARETTTRFVVGLRDSMAKRVCGCVDRHERCDRAQGAAASVAQLEASCIGTIELELAGALPKASLSV